MTHLRLSENLNQGIRAKPPAPSLPSAIKNRFGIAIALAKGSPKLFSHEGPAFLTNSPRSFIDRVCLARLVPHLCGAAIDIDRLGIGEELNRSLALLAVSGRTRLHTAKRHLWFHTGGLTVDLHDSSLYPVCKIQH